MIKPVPGSSLFQPFVPPGGKGPDPFEAITHASPQQANATQKPFATPPIPGALLPTASSLFSPLVEQITKQDVFFSDQSFRAQLHRYLHNLPTTPWMFSYTRQTTPSLLDVFFTPNKSVLLITPVCDDDQESGGQDQSSEHDDTSEEDASEESAETHIQDLLESESLSFLGDDDDIKTVTSSTSVETLVSDPSDSGAEKPTRLVLQQLFGYYLDAQHYAQLTEAYEKAKDYPEQCLWVRHYQDSIDVLGPQPPYQHGLHQVKRYAVQATMEWVSPFACRYLECYEEDEFLFLPNGGMLPLRPLAWVDGEDRFAKVFRVKRMPNGMWFKVEAVRRQADIKMSDVPHIKRTMEEWNQSLEGIGWLRDVS